MNKIGSLSYSLLLLSRSTFFEKKIKGCLLGIILICLANVNSQVLPESPLLVFLEAVKNHPGVRAARANLNAAEVNLRQAFDPIALEASGGYGYLFIDDTHPDVDRLEENAAQFSADLSFRPFPYGDAADLTNQRELNMEKTHLDYRETLTNLEVQALEAASGVKLARESLTLAEQGFEVSETALKNTRTRFDKGAANARELREAEKGLVEAQKFLDDAKANPALALLSLESLVGDVDIPDLPEFSEPLGEPLEVLKARINLDLTDVSIDSANRDLYPTAQAGYDWNVSETSKLSTSIDSRTLQPKVGFSYDGTRVGNGIESQFTVGVSMNLSPGTFDKLSVAKEQKKASEQALEAAIISAEIEHAILVRDLEQAERALLLAQAEFNHTQKVLEETRTREELGLSIPLETQQASVEFTEDDFELQSAKQEKLSTQLAFYKFYAIPPSEVLK